MARKTNKAQVLELAAELGIEVEYGPVGDGFEVALKSVGVWGTYGTGIRTEAGIWGAALRSLREFVPCAADCHCRATADDDEDLIVSDVHPIVTDDGGSPVVSTLPYVITDEVSGAEYVGTALSAATPSESMQTLVALSLGVSRETVRLWETDNYREYGFDTPRNAYRGTVRFTVADRNPYRPAPVTLTHSNHHRNA